MEVCRSGGPPYVPKIICPERTESLQNPDGQLYFRVCAFSLPLAVCQLNTTKKVATLASSHAVHDGKAPIEKICGGEIRGADLGIFGALTYFIDPEEHRDKDKFAPRARVGVYVGPGRAYGKSNGYAVLVQTVRGEWQVAYTSRAVFDTKVFPFKHGLQETLTSRQYTPLLNALKGTELELELEPSQNTDEFGGDKYDLLGRDVEMPVKGRTRFGRKQWYDKITDIIRDSADPDNEDKVQCRFFEPSAEHPDGAWQNFPLATARSMVIENPLVPPVRGLLASGWVLPLPLPLVRALR